MGVALIKGRLPLGRSAVMVMAVDIVITNSGKGGTCFVEIPGLQQALCFSITSKRTGEMIGRQFAILTGGMTFQLAHHSVTIFMGENRESTEITKALGDCIAQACFKVDRVITRAVCRCRDATGRTGP